MLPALVVREITLVRENPRSKKKIIETAFVGPSKKKQRNSFHGQR